MRRPAPAVGLAVMLVAHPAAAGSLVRDPGCGAVPVVTRTGTLLYRLPHGFVLAGSDSVRTRYRTLDRGRDYVVDALRGDLRLLHAPTEGETLWVSTCWLIQPPPLESQPGRYRPPSAAAESAAAARPAGAPQPAVITTRAGATRSPFLGTPGASLTLTGNKTIAVDFGSSQDASLRQSLDLAVSGALAPGVSLTGVLSDRNTPLTTSGSTQDLQAIDRVLIELRAPHNTATLGDLSLAMGDGEFGRIERRLQGARATWEVGGLQMVGAAASAQGEFRRLEILGAEGRQGPYVLTDRDGAPGVSVVAGSEVVTLDGQRLTRGESADYAMDYERGRLTFTSRRLITAQTRITVDYQYALNRYRRDLTAAGARWERARGWVFARALTEGDDRGRPLDITLSADDRRALAAAGDSSALAVGTGVTPGGGDYDSVRVVGDSLVYAFAGSGRGAFQVAFARVGAGRGAYAESTVVGGRTIYRWRGGGLGDFAIGRALPLPESHRLWVTGAGLRAGVFTLEAEGALSRLDRNSLSTVDDGDDEGRAGRLSLSAAGKVRGPLPGEASASVRVRGVGRTFVPFARLERPFAGEDWGVATGADLEHQDRLDGEVRYALPSGSAVRAALGSMRTPDGSASLRRDAEWTRAGALSVNARWDRADAERAGWRVASGGRERWRGEVRWRGVWLEPVLRGESDARRSPSDTGHVGQRAREGAMELRSASRLRWRARLGLALRRDGVARGTDFEDRTRARTWTAGLESPAEAPLGITFQAQRRDVLPLAAPTRTRSELGSLRLRAERPRRGLRGDLAVEITSEGVNRQSRRVVFVGGGRGAYDATGNFVGHGDYDVVLSVSEDLDRVARVATSAGATWEFGRSEGWRGSRLGYAFESETRRLGGLRAADVFVSPGVARADGALTRASLLQRLEAEVAPGSRVAALRVRLERRVTADRQFVDYGQSVTDEQGSLRWRSRPGAAVTLEAETRVRRQNAEQRLLGGASYRRRLEDAGGSGQVVVTPLTGLRLAASGEATWSRIDDRAAPTRTLRAGPDAGLALGARGRVEITARRAIVAGPPALGLLPSADPAGAPQWEGTARVDYRVRESTTLGVSYAVRRSIGHAARADGRAELRAFF